MKNLTIIIITILMLMSVAAHAQDLKLGWDDTNPAGTITGFRLYIATTPGGAASPILISGAATRTYTIVNFTGVYPALNYYLSLTAYDATNNMESIKSAEVIYTRPTTSSSSTTTSIKPLAAPTNLHYTIQ